MQGINWEGIRAWHCGRRGGSETIVCVIQGVGWTCMCLSCLFVYSFLLVGVTSSNIQYVDPALALEVRFLPPQSPPPQILNCGNPFSAMIYSKTCMCKSKCLQQDYGSAFTIPTILYRFVKKVIQSFSVPCSFSGRSSQVGRTSSALVEVRARAREASWPANAELRYAVSLWERWRETRKGSRLP